MPFLCVIVGLVGGFVAIIGVVAGIKRQRSLLVLHAASLLVVVLLDAATSHFCSELRVDIEKNHKRTEEVTSAEESFKRYTIVCPFQSKK